MPFWRTYPLQPIYNHTSEVYEGALKWSPYWDALNVTKIWVTVYIDLYYIFILDNLTNPTIWCYSHNITLDTRPINQSSTIIMVFVISKVASNPSHMHLPYQMTHKEALRICKRVPWNKKPSTMLKSSIVVSGS